jgi:uncharacterized membrane protein YdfJ with MMPL/SSD domain
MQKTRQRYLEQKQNMFRNPVNPAAASAAVTAALAAAAPPSSSSSYAATTAPAGVSANDSRALTQSRAQSRPGTRGSDRPSDLPRATSPLQPRSVSPSPTRPVVAAAQSDNHLPRQGYRSLSPKPYHGDARRPTTHSLSPQKRNTEQSYISRPISHHQPQQQQQQQQQQQAPPLQQQQQQQVADYRRRGSSADVASTQMQLAQPMDVAYSDVQPSSQSQYAANDRPLTFYGGQTRDAYAVQLQQRPESDGRLRSRSVNDGRKFTQDGRPILHHGKKIKAFVSFSPKTQYI